MEYDDVWDERDGVKCFVYGLRRADVFLLMDE